MSHSFRDLFRFKDHEIHCNNAGVSPIFSQTKDKIVQLIEDTHHRGFHDFHVLMDAYDKAKSQFASLVKASVDRVSFTQNCATAISMIAHGLVLESGDKIITWENEYSSNAYVWYRVAKNSGAQIQAISWEKNGSLDVEKMIDAIDHKTKAVVFSWFQSQTGYETPILPVLNKAREVGAWVIVDVIQGLGVAPFDLHKYPVDVVCTGGHKWMCGPLGSGALAFANDRYLELKPILEGGMSYGSPQEYYDPSLDLRTDARRFEPGAYLVWPAVAFGQSCEILNLYGVHNIQKSALECRKKLREFLMSQGVRILGSQNESLTNPSLLFDSNHINLEKLSKSLNQLKITCSLKQLGLRLSPHAFNTDDEVLKIIEVIKNNF